MSVAPIVGRRKEPILGYVPKNDDKNNLVHKGVKRFCFVHFSLDLQDGQPL